MVEKYCDINYRDYLLEIEQDEFVPGKFHYCGRSQDKVSFFAGHYSYVHHPINKFTALVDESYVEGNLKASAWMLDNSELFFELVIQYRRITEITFEGEKLSE